MILVELYLKILSGRREKPEDYLGIPRYSRTKDQEPELAQQ